MKNCPKCNAQVKDGVKFCNFCGFNIKKHEEESAQAVQSKFCPECGAKLSGGAFCPECGYRLDSAEKEKKPEPLFDFSEDTAKYADDKFGGFDEQLKKQEEAKKQEEERESIVLEKSNARQPDPNIRLKKIGDGKYRVTGVRDKSVKSVVILGNVTEIGICAFSDCSNLTEIILPDSITSIGSYAFYNCSNLMEIILPDGITSIDSCAFYNCQSLKTIIIPKSVTHIGGAKGGGPFKRCRSLTTIYCEAASKPKGWFSKWNDGIPVVWGYEKKQ